MNPIPMNKGYRRLFWGTFFMLIWGSSGDPILMDWCGIIGLCCYISGTGYLFRASECRRFLLARRWAQGGLIVCLFQAMVLIPYMEALTPWSLQFLSFFLSAAVILQVYVHVLMGAGETLGGTWITYFAKRATAFAGLYTIAVIANMVWKLIGGTGLGIWNTILCCFMMLYFLLAVWTMCIMAQLRQKYSLLTT